VKPCVFFFWNILCVSWSEIGFVMRLNSPSDLKTLTRNVLDCDQSNYYSRIIFSYTLTLEPNSNWIGWTVSDIWPFKIMQDGWRPRSWIWSNQKYSIRRPRKPYLEPNMKWIGWSVAQIWPFEIFQNVRSVVRSSVGPQYIHVHWCHVYCNISETGQDRTKVPINDQ